MPLRWNSTNNVRWKTALPDRGNATPIIWEDQIFVAQAVENEGKRLVICFDRRDGRELWRAGTTFEGKELTHEINPYCSASPVTDGERVIAFFGSAGLFCFDMEGKVLWQRDLGKQEHIWGYGASPVIYEDLCIQNFGPGERSFLIAVNKKTGETVWQVDERGHSGQEKPGEERAEWIGSWSTPIIREVQGRKELLMTFPTRVCALDPQTGKELWTCSGLNPLVYTSPLYSEGIVIGMGGYQGAALAVRAGGNGDVTESRRLWHIPRTRQRIGSGVVHGDFVYILNQPGIAECLELESGKARWEERLKGEGVSSAAWGSMVLAEDRLYVTNESGDTFVVRASPEFEVLSVNPLGERTLASPAVSSGEIFIRTYKNLWCIGELSQQ